MAWRPSTRAAGAASSCRGAGPATAPPAPSRGWWARSRARARCARSRTSRATRSPAPCGSRAVCATGRGSTERGRREGRAGTALLPPRGVRVDLAPWAQRDVEIALATEAAGAGPLVGTPGWSHVRLVSESRRARQATGAGTPSVLVVLVDTLRADHLGCYGAAPSPSPVVDRLAAGGLVFEQAVAQSSWTMPSVATLFTGLHPRSHGVVGASADGAPAASDPGFLADTLPTLAERAEAAGVTTVGVSGSPLVSRATNLARGFETFVEFGWDRARNDWPPAAEVNARFLAWLARNRALRLLAHLPYMDPHDPYTPPAALRPPAPPGVRPAVAAGQAEGLARRVNAPGGSALSGAEVEHLRRLYDAEIRAWDAELGTL